MFFIFFMYGWKFWYFVFLIIDSNIFVFMNDYFMVEKQEFLFWYGVYDFFEFICLDKGLFSYRCVEVGIFFFEVIVFVFNFILWVFMVFYV